MKKARSKIVVLLSILFITLFLAACGKQQDLSFGREAFFGVKTAEAMGLQRRVNGLSRLQPDRTACGY